MNMKTSKTKTLIALAVSALSLIAFISNTSANASTIKPSESMSNLVASSADRADHYLVTGTQDGHPVLIKYYIAIPKTEAERVSMLVMLTNFFGVNNLRVSNSKFNDVRTVLNGNHITVTSTRSKIDFKHDNANAVALMQLSADKKELTSTFIFRNQSLSLADIATSIVQNDRKNKLPGAMTLHTSIVKFKPAGNIPVIFLSHAKVDVTGVLADSICKAN